MSDDAVAIALPLVKKWEGFSPVPYLCPAGYWTRGYGERCSQFDDPVTEPAASAWVEAYLAALLPKIIRECPPLEGQIERQAGVLSWVYNLGMGNFRASTMRKRLLARDWGRAAGECRRWVYGGGRKLPGLVLRRLDEAALIGAPE